MGGALIDLGALSQPATVLVEKICNAVGMLYEPTRTRRNAKAEVDAAAIRARGDAALSDLQQRALDRMVTQETRKQKNIEDITASAIGELPADAKVNELEEDWIAYFFDKCATASDKDMQSLWAKILVSEATAPGRFSRRTIEFLSKIDKADAQAFTNLCQFACWFDEPALLVFDLKAPIYADQGLTLVTMKHLDSIGLISFESVAGYINTGTGQRAVIRYFDSVLNILFPTDGSNRLSLGHALLTSIGAQLAPICGAQKNEDFVTYLMDRWVEGGHNVVLSTAK